MGFGTNMISKIFSHILLIVLTVSTADAQTGVEFKTYSFDQLEERFRAGNDTLYVVNFWATWCKPCVKEIPYLESFHEKYKDGKVKVLLVSLDFQKHVESKLIPFLSDYDLKSEVVHLDDPKANVWIDKVNASWSGAIRATIARKGTRENFHEGSFPDMKTIEAFVNVVQ